MNRMFVMIESDVVIVGAGPAGMAAAESLSDCAVNITMIDEQPRPGGQIYRQPPSVFKVPGWLAGRRYDKGKQLVQGREADQSVRMLMSATVLSVSRETADGQPDRFRLVCAKEEKTIELVANCVLIAPGCYDLPVPFPGWMLPGVMAAGGMQAFLKSQQVLPGNRIVLAGSHPLQLIIADQVLQAGGDVAGVIFAQSRSRALGALSAPMAMLRQYDKLVQAAGALIRLKRAGVPVRFGAAVIRAEGNECLENVVVAPVDSSGAIGDTGHQEIACDRVGLCYGFLASSELARQAGAVHRWSSRDGGWVIKHDEWMSTNIPGLFVAGEATGVAGADVAEAEGYLAGIGIGWKLGRIDTDTATAAAGLLQQRLRPLRRFAEVLRDLAWPGKSLLLQLAGEADTLCRCEGISTAEVRDWLEDTNAPGSPSAVKLVSRMGMGFCQGRYCGYMLTRMVANRLQVPEQTLEPFFAGFPAKPVKISALTDSSVAGGGD